MELYLIRHAEAVPLDKDGITRDADRPLTDLGRRQARALAEALQRQGLQLDILAVSPLCRARQTAEEIVKHWTGSAPRIKECEELAPGGKAKKLARFVRDLSGDAIGLVGHQPDLSAHVAWLIGGKKAQLDLDKAGVAALHCDEVRKGEASLMFLVTPQWYGMPVPAKK